MNYHVWMILSLNFNVSYDGNCLIILPKSQSKLLSQIFLLLLNQMFILSLKMLTFEQIEYFLIRSPQIVEILLHDLWGPKYLQ